MTKDEFIRKFRHEIGGIVYDAKMFPQRGYTGSIGAKKELDLWEDIHKTLREMYDALCPDETLTKGKQ